MWAPGAKFGKYKLVERLGKGGMAETWRGELLAAEGVRKAVVIKRVLPSFSDNKEFVEAFVQEAKVTASLSHGNVAQVFDFGQVGDSHFIAMELIDGRSLDRVLKHSIARGYWHLPYPIATLIALEVAKGLEHVHTRRGPKGPLNIVHRDVSPDNIIVGLTGETKLVDFGVAKSVLAGRPETEAGVIKGKYIYFSPEQAAGDSVDFRTDIYALGVVLYRLVTGQKAFDGPGLRVLQQIQKAEFVPLKVANPDVPEELASIIETMMATHKEDRFSSTLSLVEALSSCLVHMAPRAGVHWIRDYVRWLYESDLKKRGEEPELRSGFIDLIEGWKPAPKSTSTQEVVSAESRPDEMATIASRREGHRRKATGFEEAPVEPWSTRKKLTAAAVGVAALAVLAGFVALTTHRDPTDGESDEARSRRLARETRMKPLGGGPENTTLPPEGEEGGGTEEPTPAAPSEVESPAPTPVDISYDAEAAPTSFTLYPQHHVLLDGTPQLPGSSGALAGARPLPAGVTTGAHATWSAGDRGQSALTISESHEVPAWLFSPGRPPSLELVGGSGNARWSKEKTRIALLVGSSPETPTEQLTITANGRQFTARGAVVVVDSIDRFTIRDLTGQASWKVTVTPRPAKGDSVGPVVLFARGKEIRLDGQRTVGGYAILTPGTHRLTGVSSGWVTIPALTGLKLAPVEVSFK